jgi:hypothetical protein
LPVVGFWGRSCHRTDRPWGVDDHQSPRDASRRVTSIPARTLARHTSSTNSPISHRHARNGSSGERCGVREWRGRRSSPRSSRLAPRRRPWPAGCCKNPHRMALVTASPKPGPARRQPRPGWRQAAAASWFARHAAARQGRSANRQPRLPAIARCRRCGRHGLAEGPAGPGSTAPSPDEGGGGLAPAQPLPAAEPASRHRHGPLRLGRRRPSSSPWPATTGPVPPPAARCRAPNTAGRRGCRTAARGCGRPGSASRRSAECTDGRRRAWASTCSGGPCRSLLRARWRSPRAGASSGASRGLTALGLVARLRPTRQAGGHGQVGAASRFHRTLRR